MCTYVRPHYCIATEAIRLYLHDAYIRRVTADCHLSRWLILFSSKDRVVFCFFVALGLAIWILPFVFWRIHKFCSEFFLLTAFISPTCHLQVPFLWTFAFKLLVALSWITFLLFVNSW